MKKLLFSLILMLLPIIASADTVEINGIYYNLQNNGETQVTSNPNKYSGSVVIPKSFQYNGNSYSVTSISYDAFNNCTGLTSVTIPNSVKSIGYSVFKGCSRLQNVKIKILKLSTNDDIKTIGLAASKTDKPIILLDDKDNEIKDWVIPDGFTTIGEKAFLRCTGLTSVTLGRSIESIGFGAFQDCTGLTAVTVKSSPSTVVESSLFKGCTNLKEVSFDCETVTSLFRRIESLNKVTMTDNVTSIGNSAFENCTGLKSIIIPNSVTSIDEYAFYNCSSLTSITIPNSVTSIGNNAFMSCTGLTSVIIPNSVTSIGYMLTSGCNRLKNIKIKINKLSTYDDIKTIGLVTSDTGKPIILLDDKDSEIKDLVIPNGITTIDSKAFYNCTGLTSVTIPNSVKSIGKYAFKLCSGLTSVIIPKSVTSIDDFAFQKCSNLKSVTVKCSPSTIGTSPFLECTNLKEVSFDCETVTQLFKGYGSINKISMTDNVKSIDEYAFYGCTGLTSVTIPNSVTSIGEKAFENCFNINTITIGNSVTTIGSYAFADLNLVDVYCMAENVPSANSNSFLTITKNPTLHVPNKSINAYKSQKPWSEFRKIVGINESEYTLTYIVDGNVYKQFSYNEGDDITPEATPTKEGYTFSGWSEIPATMPAHDVTVTGSFTKDALPQCATPIINFSDDVLSFSCATQGVEFVSVVTVSDAKNYYDSKINLSQTYKVSVYATKNGYERSDIATKEIVITNDNTGSVEVLTGDVNGDGVVNVADHVKLSDIIKKSK